MSELTTSDPASPTDGAGPSPRPRLGLSQWLLVALIALLGGALGALLVSGAAEDVTAVDAPAAGEVDTPGVPVADVTSELAQALGPAVVRIDAQRGMVGGSGSGVVYDDDLVITNAHVIADATRVMVTLPDGQRLEPELVGAHPPADLAVLRLPVDALPVPTWADAEHEPAVGEPVIAIGSPFGLDGSVSAGIVSAIGRTVPVQDGGVPLVDMIQTDAAINPGNSGGALIDRTGQVIGVNTAIVSTDGSSAGVGFAIPAGIVRSIVEQLVRDGEVREASLGIRGRTLDPEVVREYALPIERGAMLLEVLEDGPAEQAGLRAGDVIVGLDGEPIDSLAELAAAVRLRTPGDEVTLQVWRDGREREIAVELGARPDQG